MKRLQLCSAAWHYKAYAHEQSAKDLAAYAAGEVEARSEKRELWADAHPVPPWVWRQGVRPGTPAKPNAVIASGCFTRPTCGQLGSYDEALRYLRQCGAAGIDGDGDGVPCESFVDSSLAPGWLR